MLNRRTLIGLLAASPIFCRTALAASPEIFSTGGSAINGIDTVAYFGGNGPVAGLSDHTLMWRGAAWKFASATNMASFEMDPEKFAPQYGGYCAFAMSKGALATTDPAAWTIYEERLFLNYSINVRAIWQEDVPGNIERANGFWPGILG